MEHGFLHFISALFGWVYTFNWSLSFYPQPILNYRRRSTSGTTVDFPFINTLGFLAYTVSNLALYYSPLIRSQYAARHDGFAPTVQFNDVVFAAHALLLCAVIYSQYFPRLWGFAQGRRGGGWRPSSLVAGISAGCAAGCALVVALVLAALPGAAAPAPPPGSWAWLDAVYAASYVKLVITVVKYTPQAVVNWRNQSTRGWSIAAILLDFTGGLLSIVQLVIDSLLQGNWSGVTGNPVKFALGNVSIVYDLIFMVQHYILYRGAEGKAEETDPMFGDEERRIE